MPSSFQSYQAPVDVHEGPPCISHDPSVVLRATVQLRNWPIGRHAPQGTDSYTSLGGKFDTRYPGLMLGGRFCYLECIAEGVSAVVITAEDTFKPSQDVVVIKVMHQKYRECALQEARLLRFLNSKDVHDACHVIRLRSLFEFHGHVCLVMDRLYGSLLDYLGLEASLGRSNQALVSDLRKIAYQLLTSLDFLRAAGLTHADLKLENILMCRPCTAVPDPTGVGGDRGWGSMGIKLADFGNAFGELNHEEEDFDIQTLSYRAPEVLFGAGPLTPAIDMWSLGCIIAELALRRLLFAAQTPGQLLQQMTAALGGIPPRALFGSGRLYARVCKEAGSPSPGHFGWGSKIGFHGGAQHFGGAGVRSKLGAALSAIDPPLADLVCRLLEYDPALRPTPEEAREHPFFKILNPERAIRDAFPSALGGLPFADIDAERNMPASAMEGTTSGRNGLAEANGAYLKAAVKTAPLFAESNGTKYGTRRFEIAEKVPGVLFHKRGGPLPNGFLVEEPPFRPAKKRKSGRVAEAPGDVPDDVSRVAAVVTAGAGKRASLACAPAQRFEEGAATEKAPSCVEGPGDFMTSARGVTDAESVSAAQLKSTPLKVGRTERLLGLAKPPPFCNTGWTLGEQVAASFERGVEPLIAGEESSRKAQPPGFAVKVLKGWKGREDPVWGPGTPPVSLPVETTGLEQMAEATQEGLRLRPVAVHTWGRPGDGDDVNTPGEVSFAASLVARQGRQGTFTFVRRGELERAGDIDAAAKGMGLVDREACEPREDLPWGKGTDDHVESERLKAPISGVGVCLERGGIRTVKRGAQEPSAAGNSDVYPRARGSRPHEPVPATAVVGMAPKEVAQTAARADLREQGKVLVSPVVPSRGASTEGACFGLASVPLPVGGALAEPVCSALNARGGRNLQPFEGGGKERSTAEDVGGPPDSDSCGSAVLSSPPSGEKRLNEVGRAGKDGEVESPPKVGGNLATAGNRPAASELSLTVGPCWETRAKRKRDGDPSAKPRGEGGVGEREKRSLRRGGAEIVEVHAEDKDSIRTRSASRSEGRDETPPLQRQRVLPRRPARDEKSVVPWWIAVPSNTQRDPSDTSLELL
ncbi:Putative serine/Threonine protein kinases [Klebsormidium nitens]|uniref:Putative serine/Threonine protein kinases n=1 Tax=Klebsormidium nitens TaxID=105231 RepID=A0A1Y1IGF3_KLENI|nr:Putative serine/Threonine protein kinases [Klebsormidium nitens]|eukprot:GAQ88579.1 Putative serine/Threonine protein kinases [Klebsormidium nitens]